HRPNWVGWWISENHALASVGQCFAGHGAIATERAIPETGDGLEVLGHEECDRDAIPSVDGQGHLQVRLIVSVEEPQFDPRVCLSDALHGRALEGAVAAPGPG